LKNQILPPSISVPFLEISSRLELPPTATYSALNLWNFTALSSQPEFTVENLKVLNTFTGTRDEEWFYLISIIIEARGAKIIPVMLKAIDAARQSNSSVVLSALSKFTECVREIGSLLKRMYEQCSPNVFYNQIRPFLAGSKNMAVAGLPHGVFYDEGNGQGKWHQYSGGSNAQSSLIQFFDIVLGVEHNSTSGSNKGFLQVSRA
jgi:indoleamine 2,3-dioxygenase